MTRAAPDVEEVLSERALSQWAQAISHVAGHYRVACSPVQFRPTPRGLGVKAERPP